MFAERPRREKVIPIAFYNENETKKVEWNAIPESDPSDFAEAILLCFPMFPERFRSRKNYPEFIRQVPENDSPEESLDVFLTDTYLCKNCVRNRTVVRWICTISPSGDPPGRKVLGNVIVFMHSGNHQEIISKDFSENIVFPILFWPG